MHYRQMSWFKIREYLREDQRIVLTAGAVEQHAYLSLLTDHLIPFHIASRATRAENVLLAPPLQYGYSQWLSAYPGTLTLSSVTYLMVIKDLLRSFIQSGFKKIVILNGHGGNRIMSGAITDVVSTSREVSVHVMDWYKMPKTRACLESIHPVIDHANWAESFPFTRVADIPEGEKEYVTFPTPYINGEQVKELLGDGCRGGLYNAPADQMKLVLHTAVTEFREFLAGLKT